MARQSRCCMCPQTNSDRRICPGISGTPHPVDTICDFVKQFKDERGWIYFVRGGLGENSFKTFYKKDPNKPAFSGEKGYAKTPWCDSFDKAQKDLNELATRKGWTEYAAT